MLLAAQRVARAAACRRVPMLTASPRLARPCTGSAYEIDDQSYQRLVSLTLESVQEIYENEGDDDASLEMEVVYSVRMIWPCPYFF